MPGIKVHDGSSWSSSFSSNMRIHDGSTWQPALKGWVHDGTNWNQFYPSAPINTVAPTITSAQGWNGLATYTGDTLTASTGTWSGNPTSYSYQWYSNEGIFAGETSASMYIGANRVPYFGVRCYVTATNASGSTTVSTSDQRWPQAIVTGLSVVRLDSASCRIEWDPILNRWGYWTVEIHALPSPPGDILNAPTTNAYKWGSDIQNPDTQSATFFHNGLLYAFWISPFIGSFQGSKGNGLGWKAAGYNQTS